MKWKEMMITIPVCALLIAGSTWGFSFLYRILFRPGTIVEDLSASSDKWQEEQAQYAEELLYPFSYGLESGILAQAEAEYLLSEFLWDNTSIYHAVLELAGWEEDLENAVVTEYEYQPGAVEYEDYGLRILFRVALAREDGNGNMIVAVNQGNVPVLLWYGTAYGRENGADDAAISHSVVSPDALPEGLYDHLAQIDAAYMEQNVYWKLVRDIEGGIPFPPDVELPQGSLVRYSQYGEWQVYSDSQTAAYVCVINDCNFILYYDMRSGRFCGYNLAYNRLG